MQIDERMVGDVVVLDLKGKITLGEGDELLKDKVNSLVNQGHKKVVLNLAGVPYIDSAGLGEVVRTYTTVSRQGRQPQAAQPDQAHHRSAVDHQAADRVRDLRERERRRPEFCRIGQGLARPVLRGPPRFRWRAALLPPPWRRPILRSTRYRVAQSRLQSADLSASGAVDEEPAGLRRPAVRTTAGRSGRHRRRPRGLRRVLRCCRASSTSSTTSRTATAIAAIR